MTEDQLSEFNQVLRLASAVASSEPGRALDILDEALSKAVASDLHAASALARHAGAIADNLGETARTLAYYQLAVRCDPLKASLHLAIAHVLKRMGDLEEARAALSRCTRLAEQSGESDLVNLAASILEDM